MLVGFVQWPDGLIPKSETWSALAADVASSAPDVLTTNEIPFGPWLVPFPSYNSVRALESARISEEGLVALRALRVPVAVSWRAASAMVAIVSGCYGRSSDRVASNPMTRSLVGMPMHLHRIG